MIAYQGKYSNSTFLVLIEVQVKPLTTIVKHKAIPIQQHIMLYNVKD